MTMTFKNFILLHNDEFGYYKCTVLSSQKIFDRVEMTNQLEAIETRTYVYDDIVHINITNLSEIKTITDLPRKLKTLDIKNATLNTLTIPEHCIDITRINISDSNLNRIPEIHFLTKLTELTIQNSNIQHLPSSFPNSLISLNLSGNSLSAENCDLFTFPKNIPIILFNNQFIEKISLPGYNFCYGSQCTRTHKIMTDYRIQRNDARNIILDVVGRPDVVGRDIPQVNEQEMFNSTQTVHISSICNSVSKSIQKVKKLTNHSYTKEKQRMLLNEFMDKFYNTSNNDSWYEYIVNIFSHIKEYNNSDMKETINVWINDMSIHTKTQICYGELLARVWILVKNHDQKEDFIENIKIELNSSVGMCFTGRINRLVNALVGFVDEITVGISIKEQLQLEIGKIIAKLSKKEINYDDAVKEITILFEEPDVKEDKTVTSYYKQAWLDALDDYKEEEELEPSAPPMELCMRKEHLD